MKTLSCTILALAVCVLPVAAQNNGGATSYERQVSVGTLLPNFGHDQARIWSSPRRLNHKREWIPVAAVLATTAALIAADPHDEGYFRRTSDFSGFNRAMSSNITAASMIAAPAAFLIAGVATHNPKATGTALLTAEAVADSWVVTTVLKNVFMRARPSEVLRNGNYSDTWFEHRTSVINPNGGMPSGHATYAFAMATVIAHRYGNHRWIPYVSYGLASAVAFSRVTTGSHFFSDAFVGAAIGYSVSRFAVLQQ